MKFIDLFCGLGGFRIGFERNGFECVFSSDHNAEVQETYLANFNERPYGDITKIDPTDIPEFEVLCAGFPCQPFSASGLQKGFNDTRGTLFFDICRIIEAKKPNVIVLENVKNLVYHDGKKTFKVVVDSLTNLGYFVNCKILNAVDFGLPQTRERIFIVATKWKPFNFKYLEVKKALPLKTFLDKDADNFLNISEYTIIDDEFIKKQPSGLIFVGHLNKNPRKKIKNLVHSRSHKEVNRIYSDLGFSPTILADSAGRNYVNVSSSDYSDKYRIYSDEGFSPTILADSSGRNYVNVSSSEYNEDNRIYSADGFHPTLLSRTRGKVIQADSKVRKLTIEECFRIMGFPEDYKKVSKLGKCYEQIGNSVAVNITEAIAKELVDQGFLPDLIIEREKNYE
jgi:DNA (cytosine-5)-methyltransferase 1